MIHTLYHITQVKPPWTFQPKQVKQRIQKKTLMKGGQRQWWLNLWVIYFQTLTNLALLMFLTLWTVIHLVVSSFVLYLATGHIFGLVLWFGFGLGCNGWWVFFWGFCQRNWLVGDCTGFSSVSRRCLLHGDCRGTERGGVLCLSPNGRVVAVTGTAEATHTLSWRLGAVHWNEEKTWLRMWSMDGLEKCLYFVN